MGEVLELFQNSDPDALACELVEFLNEKTGKRFETHARDGSGLSHASRRALRLLRAGYDADDIRSVIAMKVREWNHRPAMRPYLRPSTLLAPENFEEYYGELS